MLIIKKAKEILPSTPLLISVVFFAAAFFRLLNLNLIEFKTDEAVNLFLASRPLFGYPFPPGGTVSSIGILNPPLFNYILFPAIAISSDPRFISFLIALVNSISIVAFFLIARRYYSTVLAFVASIFMAFSPWAILYSRKIWMQDLLVPFFVLLFLAVHKLIVEKKQVYWILYFVSSLFIIQLHQTSIIFIFLLTFSLFIKKTKPNVKYILLGLIIGALPLIPYFYYDFANKCTDCSTFFSSGAKLTVYHLEIFERPFQILSQGDFRFEMGDSIGTFAAKFPLAYKLRALFYIEYALLPLGFIFFIKKYRKFSFFAYSAVLLSAVYFLLKIESFMHYYIIIMPLLFLFLAAPFEYFIRIGGTLFKTATIILFAVLISTSIIFDISFFSFVGKQGKLNGDYGATFVSSTENGAKVKMDEKYFAGFIPLSYMFGYQPLGRMLYGNTSKKDIPMLEKILKKNPDDKITQYKILAFYTKEPETPDTLNILKQKDYFIPQYLPIYSIVYQHYLAVNFKKEFDLGAHMFFYPQHWLAHEEGGIITLTGDGYSVTIKNLGSGNMVINCVNGQNKCNNGTINEIKNSIGPVY